MNIGKYFLAAIMITTFMVINIDVGFEEVSAESSTIMEVNTSVKNAFANPCTGGGVGGLDCGTSNVYCGSITVNPAGGPSYTIVCSGGEGGGGEPRPTGE